MQGLNNLKGGEMDVVSEGAVCATADAAHRAESVDVLSTLGGQRCF